MAYGSELLRKAGQSLMDFDARYAARAAKDMGGLDKSPLKVALGGVPLNSPTQNDGNTWQEKLAGNAMLAGMYATNVGYRYGLPAAGLTLAGKGLYDLTNSMNQQTDATLDA